MELRKLTAVPGTRTQGWLWQNVIKAPAAATFNVFNVTQTSGVQCG